MDKKVNIITLILVILIILILGIGIGYLITTTINNTKIVSEKAQPQIEEQIEKIVETPKYDGSKSITVNGKTYTVSYKNELPNEYDVLNTTIYLNDKKLKTYAAYYEFSDKNLDITTIQGDTEYIVIIVRPFDVIDENVYLIIINQEEELVDTVQVHSGNLGIYVYDIPDIEGYTYKIYDNNIIFYKLIGQPKPPITKDGSEYYVAVYKITIENNKAFYKLERLCTFDEVRLSGK